MEEDQTSWGEERECVVGGSKEIAAVSSIGPCSKQAIGKQKEEKEGRKERVGAPPLM